MEETSRSSAWAPILMYVSFAYAMCFLHPLRHTGFESGETGYGSRESERESKGESEREREQEECVRENAGERVRERERERESERE